MLSAHILWFLPVFFWFTGYPIAKMNTYVILLWWGQRFFSADFFILLVYEIGTLSSFFKLLFRTVPSFVQFAIISCSLVNFWIYWVLRTVSSNKCKKPANEYMLTFKKSLKTERNKNPVKCLKKILKVALHLIHSNSFFHSYSSLIHISSYIGRATSIS